MKRTTRVPAVVRWMLVCVCLCASGALPTSGQQSPDLLFDAPVVEGHSFTRFNRTLDFDENGLPDAVGYWFVTEDSFYLTAHRNVGGRLSQTWIDTFDGDRNEPGLEDWLPLDAGTVNGLPAFAVDTREDGLRIYTWEFGFPSVWKSFAFAGVTDIHIADMDGNGFNDVVALAGTTVHVIRTFGDDSPEVNQFTLAGAARERLTIADLDGAGTLEFATWDAVGVDLYHAAGATFVLDRTVVTTVGLGKLTAGDIDNDLDTDLVYFGHDFPHVEYEVFRRTGADTFVIEAPVAGGPASDLVDLNGDGKLDALCCGGGGGPPAIFNDLPVSFYISIQDEFGAFPVGHTIEGLGANHLAGAVDMDDDGDIDLVAGRVIRYARPGSYDAPATFTSDAPVAASSILDLEGDGDDDLAIGGGGSSQLNQADGAFEVRALALPTPPAGMSFSATGYPGDWNGDGKTDLIVEMFDGGGAFVGMRLLADAGGVLVDGGFAADPGVRLGRPGYNPMDRDAAFRAIDANGDGALDFAFRVGAGAGRLWWNDGSGFFASEFLFVEGYVTHAVDFDADGLSDLVLQDPEETHVRFGTQGGYTDAVRVSLNYGELHSVGVGDANGNGRPDLVTMDRAARVIFVINKGDRTFRTRNATGLSLASSAIRDYSIDYVDLNADGRRDLLIEGNGRESNVVTYALGSETLYRFDGQTVQLGRPSAVCDVDGDGDADLVVRRATDDRNLIVRNLTFDGANDGTVRQYGTGLAGDGGRMPVLGARGPFRPGEDFEIRLRNGVGDGMAILVIGDQPAETPARGGMLYVEPWKLEKFRLDGPPGEAGLGEFTLSFDDVPARAIGARFYLQFGVVDPAAVEGVALSNALELQFGSD